jgi:hypothetical protein
MARGEKDFENRKDDRRPKFKVGDLLVLREWEPDVYEYTGRYLLRIVTYIIRGVPIMIADGWCCMQTRPAPETLLDDEAREEMKRGDSDGK